MLTRIGDGRAVYCVEGSGLRRLCNRRFDMFTFPTDLQGFVVWLGTAGAGGVIVAMLLERVAAFRNWKSPFKGYAVMLLFVLLPFASNVAQWALTSLDPAVLAKVQQVLGLALTGLLAWGASQYGHQSDPHRQ